MGDVEKAAAILKSVLAVAFRDIQKATWRASVAPPPNKTTPIQVTIQGLNVTVAMAGSGS